MQTFTAEELSSEEWRDILGYEGLYRISSLGRVRGMRTGRVLKHDVSAGYSKVQLFRSGRGRIGRVHTMVMAAFVGARPFPGAQIRHFPDRDTRNNRLSNLAWGTAADNQADRLVHGTDCRGSKGGRAVLDEAAVMLARWLRHDHGVTYGELAEWFGIAKPNMFHAVKGHTWASVAYGLEAR